MNNFHALYVLTAYYLYILLFRIYKISTTHFPIIIFPERNVVPKIKFIPKVSRMAYLWQAILFSTLRTQDRFVLLFLQHHVFNIKDNQVKIATVQRMPNFIFLCIFLMCNSLPYLIFVQTFVFLVSRAFDSFLSCARLFLSIPLYLGFMHINYQAYLCVKKHICQSYTTQH